VLGIRKPDVPIDLFMVEIMHMRHKFDVDTRLVGVHFLTFLNILAKYHISLNE
jgi:hypothetical protein